jgi:hypothetical protein
MTSLDIERPGYPRGINPDAACADERRMKALLTSFVRWLHGGAPRYDSTSEQMLEAARRASFLHP